MKETCKAYGFKHGPIHAEFRVNHDEIWLIELAARTIGGKCGRIIEWSTGRALEEIVILNALGRPIPEPHSDVPVGVMMIPVPKSGTLRRVEGIEAAMTGKARTSLFSFMGPAPEESPHKRHGCRTSW